MKALLISRYAQPGIKFSNSNVYKQAKSLHVDYKIDVEILTWPLNDGWEGPVSGENAGMAIPPLRFKTEELVYHVINPPFEWNARVLTPDVWNHAVEFGKKVLQSLNPDIVHLHHWAGLWWMLEAAQQIGIPTVYSNHDWGIACLRTVLVKGDGSLCDGCLSVEKCSHCIWQGRGFVGRVNEMAVQNLLGRRVVALALNSPLKDYIEKRGVVKEPLTERTALHLNRVKQIMGKLNAMLVPSDFARKFFSRLGVNKNCISVKSWYHDPINRQKKIADGQPFTLSYIGRVSPEKGLHIILEALKRVTDTEAVNFKIAGSNPTKYCTDLKKKYGSQIGQHKVFWLGWTEVEPLFLSTDVVTIPSSSIDNTPLSLVEAISYKVPVIATKIPPIEELIIDGRNGYLAEFNSIESLVFAIKRAIVDKQKIRSNTMSFPSVCSCKEYTKAVFDSYLKCERK